MQYAENELGIIQHHLPACLCVSARRQVRNFAEQTGAIMRANRNKICSDLRIIVGANNYSPLHPPGGS